MKQSIFALCFSLLLAFTAISLSSCSNEHGHDHATEQADEATDKSGPEYTSAYVCPMHCEGSGSDEPGKCPVCGMDYVANEDRDGSHDDGHNH